MYDIFNSPSNLASTAVCSGLPESKARALDNMGRAYAKMGCYKKAINMYVIVVALSIVKTEVLLNIF